MLLIYSLLKHYKSKKYTMKKISVLSFLFVSMLVFSSCGGSSEESPIPEEPIGLKIAITPGTVYQTIAGFGGANRMWGTESLNATEAAKAFGTGDNQLGLSIFRVRLSSNKAEWPIIVDAVKEANKNGVKVLACPWSPPANLKSNNSDIGGYLLPKNYTAFKDYINDFIVFMNTNGAKIDVVSIQNEPDIKVTYESCDYSPTDFINFIKAPGQIVGAKLAAPESFNFNPSLTDAVLSDDAVAQKIDIVAGHIYGGGIANFPLAEQKKKEIWMTEFLLNLNTGNAGAAKWSTYSETVKWAESLKMLSSIHDAMSSNWNAYIWWYLKRYYSFIGDGEEGTINGDLLKRGVAFSHFSKFVRPGFVRIGTDLSSKSFLKVSVYKKDNQTVIEIINPENTTVNNVQFSGLTTSTAVSYTTTETISMQKKQLTVANNLFAVNVLPNSITTIVVN